MGRWKEAQDVLGSMNVRKSHVYWWHDVHGSFVSDECDRSCDSQ